jgi:hypothetical protein
MLQLGEYGSLVSFETWQRWQLLNAKPSSVVQMDTNADFSL